MSVSPHDGGVQSSGLIIPENIPGDDLKPSRLEQVARTLRTSGSGAVEQAETAETTWSGLPAVLESPQGPVIYAALGTPSTAARAVDGKFSRVADALDDFATALRPIKNEFAAIKQDAVAFRATITWDERVWVSPQETKEYEGNALTQVSSSSSYTSYSQPRTLTQVLEYLRGRGETARSVGGRPQILAHWTESSEHIDQNNVLMDRLADAYAKLQNAEADCANAINRQRESCLVEVEYIEAWQLKQSDELTVVMPWGSRVDEDRNCGESFWWGAGNAGKEALEGVGGLFGYNSLIDGWEWDKSWQTAGESWWGVVTGLGSLLVITSPPLMLLGMAGVPVLKDGVATGQEMVKGLLAWDTWAENPAEAAGRVVVNVGSMFLPGAGAASAAIKALTAGSHIIDLAGDASRLTHAADTGVTKVDGLLPKLDGLSSEVAGAGGAVDDLVGVGSKIDMPDSSLLHVGTRTPDAPPPGSLLDDAGGSGYPPRRPVDDGSPGGATGDGPPPRRPDDGDGPRGGAADDPPPPRKPDDDDPPPPRPDDDDPPPPRPDDDDVPPPRDQPDDDSPAPVDPDDPGPPRDPGDDGDGGPGAGGGNGPPVSNFWDDADPGQVLDEVRDVKAPDLPEGMPNLDDIDFTTAPDSALFWSGRTNGAGGVDLAYGLSGARGMASLERFLHEHGVHMPKYDIANPASVDAWKAVSVRLAEAAQGDVHVLLGTRVNPKGVFYADEFPALRANPKVDRVIAVDPETGALTLLWTKGDPWP
jgi:hypothetical protein